MEGKAKKALSVVSLLSLFLGLALFVGLIFRRSPPSAPTLERAGAGREAPLASARPPAPAEVAPGPLSSGTLSVYVHKGALPEPGAWVLVQESGGPTYVRAKTGESGRQVIQKLPPGSYTVSIRSSGCIPMGQVAQIRAGQTTDLEFALKPGGKIHGTVTSDEGKALAECLIRFASPVTGKPVLSHLATQTNDQGQYRVEGLPFEPLELSIQNLRFRPWKKKDLWLREDAGDLEINAVLDKGLRVIGRVVDERGEPIAGARVMATNEYSFVGTTDQDGRFVIYGMAPESMTLSARARGYGTRYLWQRPPSPEEFTIVLRKAGRIGARLFADPLPSGLSAALVRMDAEFGREFTIFANPHRLASDEWAVEEVDPGIYRLELGAAGYETVDHPTVRVGSGEDPKVAIRMVRVP